MISQQQPAAPFRTIAARRVAEVREPTIRRSVDGRDIYVFLAHEALAANPSYVLAMRGVGCRKRNWARFFLSPHMGALCCLGLAVGGAVRAGLAADVALLALPMALAYHVWRAEISFHLADDLRRRGQLQDLYLISFYDPLLLGAGIVCAEAYQRARLGAAAATGAGVALIAAGASDPAALRRFFVVGAALLLASLVIAARTAVLSKGRTSVVTYRQIMQSLSRLRPDFWTVLRRSMGLALACVAAGAVVAWGVLFVGGMPPEVAALLCLGAFFAFRRPPAPDAPGLDEARREVVEAILRAME